ncbi:hypothetical protein L1887_07032 [Cichorium endivia]|nr:hypothetical protein L1887_07032 [Cichorium endivia]
MLHRLCSARCLIRSTSTSAHKSAIGFPYSTKSANLALILISKQKELPVESSRQICVGEFEKEKKGRVDLKRWCWLLIVMAFISSTINQGQGYRGNHVLQGLLNEEIEEEEEDNHSYTDNMSDTEKGDHEEFRNPPKTSEEILIYRTENGLICKEFPVKDENGNKMVNEYVRECKIGAGSYGKVVII